VELYRRVARGGYCTVHSSRALGRGKRRSLVSLYLGVEIPPHGCLIVEHSTPVLGAIFWWFAIWTAISSNHNKVAMVKGRDNPNCLRGLLLPNLQTESAPWPIVSTPINIKWVIYKRVRNYLPVSFCISGYPNWRGGICVDLGEICSQEDQGKNV
jgi:hypothetical protein